MTESYKNEHFTLLIMRDNSFSLERFADDAEARDAFDATRVGFDKELVAVFLYSPNASLVDHYYTQLNN